MFYVIEWLSTYIFINRYVYPITCIIYPCDVKQRFYDHKKYVCEYDNKCYWG